MQNRVDRVRTDVATGVISSPALYLQHGIILRSIGDPRHVDCIFVGHLDTVVGMIWVARIGEVVSGQWRAALRECRMEALEKDQNNGCGCRGEEMEGIEHRQLEW